MDAVEALSAAGTIALVAVTWWYARSTMKLSEHGEAAAQAAMRTAEASERQLYAAWRPNIVTIGEPEVRTANERSELDESGRDRDIPKEITIRVENAGPGPAHNVGAELVLEGQGYRQGTSRRVSLPLTAQLTLTFSKDPAAVKHLFDLTRLDGAFRVGCEDALGRRWTTEWSVTWSDNQLSVGERRQIEEGRRDA